MNKPLLIIVTISGLLTSVQFLLAQDLIDIKSVKGIIIDVIYNAEKNNATLNPSNITNVDFLWKDFKVNPGEFRLIFVSKNNKILDALKISLANGRNILELPYFLNLEKIIIEDKYQNKIIEISNEQLLDLPLCNENKICESSEENLCPLDCESANNPNYPLTFAGNIDKAPIPQPLERTVATLTPETAKNQLRGYLMLLGLGIGFLLIFFGILYWYNKGK